MSFSLKLHFSNFKTQKKKKSIYLDFQQSLLFVSNNSYLAHAAGGRPSSSPDFTRRIRVCP